MLSAENEQIKVLQNKTSVSQILNLLHSRNTGAKTTLLLLTTEVVLTLFSSFRE